METWPGEFRFAGLTISPSAASRHACSTSASVGPDDRGHRPGPDRHRLLHVAPAAPDDRHGVGKRKGAGGDVRRVLAEAVPGHETGFEAARRQHPVCGHAHGQDRRLGVLGERELVFGAVLQHRPQRGAGTAARRTRKRGFGLGERRLGLGKRRGERLPHPDLLRPLSGKHERDPAAHETPASATPRVTWDTTSLEASRAAIAMALRTALADERPCATMAVPATPSSGAPPYSE